MLLVKTYIAPSKINGIGLFAAEDIKKGTMTWKFEPNFDLYFTKEEVSSFSEHTRQFIQTYAYLSMGSGKYVLCSDDSRFTNHSTNPNTDQVSNEASKEPNGVALRDIKKGEEITVDYRKFDAKDAQVDRGDKTNYLNK